MTTCSPRERPPSGAARRLARAAAVALISAASCLVTVAAEARKVTLVTKMAETYRGVGGYIVIYITDAERTVYKGTLWAAGRSARYYGQFRHWWRATEVVSKRRQQEYDGVSGPSLAGGETLTLDLDLADELFDAGLVLRVDSTVQKGRDYPSDVVLPLNTSQAGIPAKGRGYVDTVTFTPAP